MARLPSLRASDADREDVATRLRRATTEGRLSGDELEERLEALYTSRTYGELDALVADLPVIQSSSRPRVRVAPWAGAAGALTVVLAAFGMLGVARRHYAATVGGSAHIRHTTSLGQVADPHHGLIVAVSTVGVLVLVLVCAGLIWLWMQSRSTSDV